MKRNIFTIEDGNRIIEWEVKPNDLIPGWFVLTSLEVIDGYSEIRPTTKNALDHVKKNPGYIGLDKLNFYDDYEDAQIALIKLKENS